MMGKRLKEIFGLILINITLVSGSLNAETVYADTQAKIEIVSLALELVSRWKKRQSGTEIGSYGKAAGIRKQGETGDVFSEYQNRKGLKQKDGTWNPQSDTEQQGWRRDSSVEKEKTW